MRGYLLAILLCVTGCTQPAPQNQQIEAVVADNSTTVIVEPSASPTAKVKVAPTTADDGPMDDLTIENTPKHIGREVVSMCWQDYCPCDPPQGGADKGLCRQLKAGMKVDDEIMAAAAMSRDAREQLDQWERDNP